MNKLLNEPLRRELVTQKSEKPLFRIHVDTTDSPDKDVSSYTERRRSTRSAGKDESLGEENEEPLLKARFSETLEQHLLRDMSQFHGKDKEGQEIIQEETQSKELVLSKLDETIIKIEEPSQEEKQELTSLLSQTNRKSEESRSLGSKKIPEPATFHHAEAAEKQDEIKPSSKYYEDKDILSTSTYSADTKAIKQTTRQLRTQETKFSEDSIPLPTEREPQLIYKDLKVAMEIQRCPSHCEKFLDVIDYAKLFVDGLMTEAIQEVEEIERENISEDSEDVEYIEESEKTSSTENVSTYVCVLNWPTIEQFTMESGIAKINEYLSYWQFEEDWKYCIDFLQGNSDAACDFYHYEVIFSIPCKQYPIPQITASVYFTFEVSRVRPRSCFVDVYYSFEGQRLIYTPGKFICHEKWLFNIVDAKIKFFKTLTF